MSLDQAYLSGFFKQAEACGFSKEEARALVKNAGIWNRFAELFKASPAEIIEARKTLGEGSINWNPNLFNKTPRLNIRSSAFPGRPTIFPVKTGQNYNNPNQLVPTPPIPPPPPPPTSFSYPMGFEWEHTWPSPHSNPRTSPTPNPVPPVIPNPGHSAAPNPVPPVIPNPGPSAAPRPGPSAAPNPGPSPKKPNWPYVAGAAGTGLGVAGATYAYAASQAPPSAADVPPSADGAQDTDKPKPEVVKHWFENEELRNAVAANPYLAPLLLGGLGAGVGGLLGSDDEEDDNATTRMLAGGALGAGGGLLLNYMLQNNKA